MAESVNPTVDVDQATLAAGLRTVRRRRWYLWATILIYLPAMWLTLQRKPSLTALSIVFLIWFFLLFTTAMFAAVAICPRCGNRFHLHGMSLLYYRRCLHCQLHVCADKRQHPEERTSRSGCQP